MSTGLTRLLSLPEPRRVIAGLLTGVVTSNDDPQRLGRVQVHLPSIGDDIVTPWARIAAPMAGKQRGFYTLPEVGDEVLVGFEHGNPEFPYVLGALWNANATPPETNQPSSNDHRSWTSRSGHVIRLDDTNGQERIQIIDKSTNNSVVISTSDNTIQISAQGDITIASSGGKVTIKATNVEITASESMKLDAGSNVEVSASGQTTIKGGQVAIN
ncbi:MAG TPA: phage baseplate assembly protein V [Solirubrobacteraceae bacterium]|nr:phage baseplate assembly protein V [Solirubrobacteraceae bacterium]